MKAYFHQNAPGGPLTKSHDFRGSFRERPMTYYFCTIPYHSGRPGWRSGTGTAICQTLVSRQITCFMTLPRAGETAVHTELMTKCTSAFCKKGLIRGPYDPLCSGSGSAHFEGYAIRLSQILKLRIKSRRRLISVVLRG